MAAVLLGVGRGFGETMAVLMASGHAINLPTSPFDSVRALTATIAAELGDPELAKAVGDRGREEVHKTLDVNESATQLIAHIER